MNESRRTLVRRCAVLLLTVDACARADATRKSTSTAPAHAVVDDGEPPVIDGDHNLIRNGSFEDGSTSPWHATVAHDADGEASIVDGAYCMQIQGAGTTAWDLQLRHRALPIEQGRHYVVGFTASADTPTRLRPKVGRTGPPYEEYWASVVSVEATPQRYEGHFVMRQPTDTSAELTFQMGGPLVEAAGPIRVCLDDIELSDPDYEPPPPPAWKSAPPVRVNQVGYFPKRNKRATYKTPQSEAVAWELVDADDAVLASGTTTVFGDDKSSGDFVHIVDFSSYETPGRELRIRIGDDVSYPFDIGEDIYDTLRYDALAYFYHNRSGIPIEMPYAGDEKWTRAAGHPNDAAVKCQPDLGCDYEVDASKGWYDAGDHGKYVVNAGITTWTLLNAYERAAARGKPKVFADGRMSIPEKRNGVPDLLDEVRWELEMLLRLQVPSGEKWEGLAFHKLHEDKWTDLPKGPHEAEAPRLLHRPSTAAALNLAAVAAQAARVYKPIDPAFSKKLLDASERAYKAAKATPDLLAPGDDNVGGGPYGDIDLSDEFYWAAAELYVTTGNATYRTALQDSKHAFAVPGPAPEQGSSQSSMTWQMVQALGTISLATAKGRQAKTEREQARKAVIAVAEGYVSALDAEGYRLPMRPGAGNRYPWGSNSLVLNNIVVLGLAADFTDDDRFLRAAIDGMDYLLGRNAMSTSYVTGYGELAFENPHHRFWAHQKDERYPPPPPGAVSGGPNSGVEDPQAQAAGLAGNPPQKCYVDHIESWSTNEVAINWNAPLAWAAAFLAEHAR